MEKFSLAIDIVIIAALLLSYCWFIIAILGHIYRIMG